MTGEQFPSIERYSRQEPDNDNQNPLTYSLSSSIRAELLNVLTHGREECIYPGNALGHLQATVKKYDIVLDYMRKRGIDVTGAIPIDTVMAKLIDLSTIKRILKLQLPLLVPVCEGQSRWKAVIISPSTHIPAGENNSYEETLVHLAEMKKLYERGGYQLLCGVAEFRSFLYANIFTDRITQAHMCTVINPEVIGTDAPLQVGFRIHNEFIRVVEYNPDKPADIGNRSYLDFVVRPVLHLAG